MAEVFVHTGVTMSRAVIFSTVFQDALHYMTAIGQLRYISVMAKASTRHLDDDIGDEAPWIPMRGTA